MLLSGQMLQLVDVNHFEKVTQTPFTQGDSPAVYFQLVDLSQNRTGEWPGLRYIPVAGATLQVTLKNVDNTLTVQRVATQPFSGDGSIWSVSFLASDNLVGTYTMTLKLTEGVNVTYGRVSNALMVSPQSGVFVPVGG